MPHNQKKLPLLFSALALLGCKDEYSIPADVESLIEKTLNNMVYVEGGSFMMSNIGYEVPEDDPAGTWVTMANGSKSYRVPFPGCGNSCYPIHKVTLDGYYMNKYETTYGEYDLYSKANDLPLVKPSVRDHRSFTPQSAVFIGVDWNGANDYCKWLETVTGLPFALPTEAQWEYAARSRGQAVRFATNNGELEPGQNYQNRGEPFNEIHPPGLFPPYPLGLYDMTGNANEWVRDWYTPHAYKNGDRTNPTGPEDDDIWNVAKVSRGFGRQHSDWNSRTLFRRLPTDIDYTAGNGFRCSLDTDVPMDELRGQLAQSLVEKSD